jgi:FkbM family methyltransferase
MILRRMGRDIVAFDPASHAVARRIHMLRSRGVSVVLDVGANAGQYAKALRSEGFHRKIVSFEPQTAAYESLSKAAANDPQWSVFNYAVGASDSMGEINIAGNSYSSSLLDMLPSHVRSAPESAYTSRERVTLRSLDSIIGELHLENEVLFLKSDTQGYEAEVLRGATESMKSIVGVEMELSLSPLYEGETLLADMIRTMDENGYALMSIDPAFADPTTGQLLQVDATFSRRNGVRRV